MTVCPPGCEKRGTGEVKRFARSRDISPHRSTDINAQPRAFSERGAAAEPLLRRGLRSATSASNGSLGRARCGLARELAGAAAAEIGIDLAVRRAVGMDHGIEVARALEAFSIPGGDAFMVG
jgi:hypothetical protein